MNINPFIQNITPDTILYVLDLKINEATLNKFRGIKYVFMQGSGNRAMHFANRVEEQISNLKPHYFKPMNLTPRSAYEFYRVGPVLSVSHGMGNTSILTLLHALTKLMYFAGNTNLEYIRLGTSGGVKVDPGSVILTDVAYTSELIAGYDIAALGKTITYPTNMDMKLNNKILAAQPVSLDFPVLRGNSIAADDFYQGQARFDGAIKINYDKKKREEYFNKIIQLNILNFEMESTALASFCNRAGIPATMISATLINRIDGDQIILPDVVLTEFSERTHILALNYLKSQLHI